MTMAINVAHVVTRILNAHWCQAEWVQLNAVRVSLKLFAKKPLCKLITSHYTNSARGRVKNLLYNFPQSTTLMLLWKTNGWWYVTSSNQGNTRLISMLRCVVMSRLWNIFIARYKKCWEYRVPGAVSSSRYGQIDSRRHRDFGTR